MSVWATLSWLLLLPHIWYFKGVPSRLGYLLDLAPKDLEKVIYFAAYMITKVDEEARHEDLPMLQAAHDREKQELEAALNADVCEIYSDVDGVFTADPRIVPTAHKLDTITSEEMLEMAANGAKILHLRSVEYARRFKFEASRAFFVL